MRMRNKCEVMILYFLNKSFVNLFYYFLISYVPLINVVATLIILVDKYFKLTNIKIIIVTINIY